MRAIRSTNAQSASMTELPPDPDDLIREGYVREANLLARCDEAKRIQKESK